MNYLLFLGKFVAPTATALAAMAGVASYLMERKEIRKEQKKLAVDKVRNSLKILRDESQFLTSYLGKDDLNSPIFLATSEIRAEINKRLVGGIGAKVTPAVFLDHLEKNNVIYFCILAGWQNSIFTRKIERSIENIKKVEPSLKGKFSVIGDLGKFMAIFIQKKFSPSMYFPFWKEAVQNIPDQSIPFQEMLDAFENELLKLTFQHFRGNNYHKMVDSFNIFLNTLTLVLLKIKNYDVLYQLSKEHSPNVNLNLVKDLSSSLNLKYSAEEYDSITFALLKELSDKQIELENALDSLEQDIVDNVDRTIFDNYKQARDNVLKDIESFIIKDDEREKEANKIFKKRFETNHEIDNNNQEQ
ncbi:hypothetical protein QUF74_09350 [Candidatus Halobeggiatoa sp. HSG11]|nr:hypothetical protein [Candidatus Halobeggiatoa sp. HSG11]